MQVPSGFRALPLSTSQLCLDIVLRCGQSFLWQIFPLPATNSLAQPSHEYRTCLQDRLVCLRQTSDALLYRAVFPRGVPDDGKTEDWLRDYFQLDVDLDALYEGWKAKDKIFEGVAGRFSGIRMLRQDPWECLMSFICSQNNHISRITKMVQSLPNAFSSPLLSHPDPCDNDVLIQYRPFPPPEALADASIEKQLRDLGFGYRAKYIQGTAARLCKESSDPRGWLKTLRSLPLAGAREKLIALDGVGPKVADCVLLMSLDKTEVVPVDTHVYQIATKHYGLKGPKGKPASMTPKLYAEIGQKFIVEWGTYAGWAHSVLFTADLKSFATYNTSSSSSTMAVTAVQDPLTLSPPPSPPLASTVSVSQRVVSSHITVTTAAATPAKRARVALPATPESLPRPVQKRPHRSLDDEDGCEAATEHGQNSGMAGLLEGDTLGDRVKRRKRKATSRTV